MKNDLSKRENINLYILIMIISGIIGFIYEEIFYFFDLGYLTKRGSTFGPWIPIYTFGGLLIASLTYKYKNSKLKVFILSLLITGILEYSTGFILDKVFSTRLWDYNKEILNFGNINGYICLRSVLLFGFAGLFLVYVLIPILIKLIKRVKSKILNPICIVLISLFFIDIITYKIIK